MNAALRVRGWARRVRFVALSADPSRDTPSRLRVYRALVGAPANWSLLTGSPAVLGRIWRHLGVWYQQVAEDPPPGGDWLTGKPLTYDLAHQDALPYRDASGPDPLG